MYILVINTISDLKYFFLIYMVSILGFANAFYVMSEYYVEDLGFAEYWGRTVGYSFIYSLRIAVGDFEMDEFPDKNNTIVIILWFVSSVLNMIIFLNMIISVMEDTFDKIQESEERLRLEKAFFIDHYEYLINRSKQEKNRYIIVIQADQPKTKSENSWHGQLA